MSFFSRWEKVIKSMKLSGPRYGDPFAMTREDAQRFVDKRVAEVKAAYPADGDFDLGCLPGFPFLPCPICKGVEGCDHTVPERARAAGINLSPIR